MKTGHAGGSAEYRATRHPDRGSWEQRSRRLRLSLGASFTHAAAPLLRCPVCQESVAGSSGVCDPCRIALEVAILRLPPPTGSAFWLGPYAGPWLRLIHALKFGGERRLAAFLGGLLATRCMAGQWRPNTVCHVPASPGRLVERGYDQAELLATSVATALGLEQVTLLVRATPTATRQARLGRAARAVNAGSAFRGRYAPGRQVLLVDDVMTTGATAAACSAALLAAGAAEVRTAVVAKTSSTR